MDQLFEILIPVIIAAVYFFSNVLNKKNGEEEGPRPPGSYEDEDEYEERQRRIQEEIRRKILERRQQQEGQGPASPAPVEREAPAHELTPADHRLRERQRQTQERVKHPEPEPEAPQPPPMPERPAEPVADARFSWDESDNIYEQQMEAQLQRIEETKRRAEALRAKAGLARQPSVQGQRQSSGSVLAGPVREQLKNRSAARAAIIYREVLGTPKGMQ